MKPLLQKDYSVADELTKKTAFREFWATFTRLERGSTKFHFGQIANGFVKCINRLVLFPIVDDHPKWNNINDPADFAWKVGDDEKEWKNVTAFGNIKNGKKGKILYLNEIERRLVPGHNNWTTICTSMLALVTTLASQTSASHGVMEARAERGNETGSKIVNRTAAAAHLFLDEEATVLYARAESGDVVVTGRNSAASLDTMNVTGLSKEQQKSKARAELQQLFLSKLPFYGNSRPEELGSDKEFEWADSRVSEENRVTCRAKGDMFDSVHPEHADSNSPEELYKLLTSLRNKYSKLQGNLSVSGSYLEGASALSKVIAFMTSGGNSINNIGETYAMCLWEIHKTDPRIVLPTIEGIFFLLVNSCIY